MYNTIEVMNLTIHNAEIKYFKKAGFTSNSVENVTHIKVLSWLSVVQSVEGSYDITLGNGELRQTGDGGFFVAPSEVQQTIVHHVNRQSGRMTCRYLFLDVVINKSYKPDSLYRFPTILDASVQAKMNQLFDALFASDNIWENYSCCYRILGLLLESAEPLKHDIPKGLQGAVEYMTSHLAERIDVATLAKTANMSESNFYAAFKKYFQTSPIAYLNYFRLTLASEMLLETEDTVAWIASQVGITDPLYFSKLFKGAYGLSPREYRLSHKGK